MTVAKVIAGLKASKKYIEINTDLLDMLEAQGKTNPTHKNIVDEYMSFWITLQLLEMDIKKRGVSLSYNNGGSQRGRRNNDSVELQVKTSKQMLRLLEYISHGMNDSYEYYDEL